MPSTDARLLLSAVVPSAAVGAIATVISGIVAGGKGAIGAVLGTLVVLLFMGIGMLVLQRTAKKHPQLFQAMGLLLYTTQLLVLAVFLAVLKGTTVFDFKAFAFTVLATTVVWVAAQARAYMKAKIAYVEPGKTGSKS
ncbi:hypothetical protein [Streptomyces roseolus]|uniref:hypothetical protein n=1 Tax=Streptomyces roseolus TaxID=67358 RepID=UPI001673A23F|nr:hypothetical protein [Streptomyces roseolus]GGR33107.1 ATP synthase protein I [Streptomyces roseolus]